YTRSFLSQLLQRHFIAFVVSVRLDQDLIIGIAGEERCERFEFRRRRCRQCCRTRAGPNCFRKHQPKSSRSLLERSILRERLFQIRFRGASLDGASLSFDARSLSLLLAFQSRELQFCRVAFRTKRLVLITQLRNLDTLFTQLIVRNPQVSLRQLTRPLLLLERGPKFRDFLLRCISLAFRSANSLVTTPDLFTIHSRSATNARYLFSMCTCRGRL